MLDHDHNPVLCMEQAMSAATVRTDILALVSVTQAYMRCVYSDDAEHALSDVIRCVRHCSGLFEWIDSYKVEIEYYTVAELAKRLEIPTRIENLP